MLFPTGIRSFYRSPGNRVLFLRWTALLSCRVESTEFMLLAVSNLDRLLQTVCCKPANYHVRVDFMIYFIFGKVHDILSRKIKCQT